MTEGDALPNTGGGCREALSLSDSQQDAVDQVDYWHTSGRAQVFYLFGYAGTGKTTIAKHIASRIDGPVGFAAYTGKASSVMTRKGCPASTLHSLLYHPKKKLDPVTGKDTGQVEFVRKENNTASRLSLVIIDECSMVGNVLGEDLMRLGVKVLVLGDPAQLPPVEGTGFFHTDKPDILLTEIHRQAETSGVLQLATAVRTGQPVQRRQYLESEVVSFADLNRFDPTSFDQILVGTNNTRVYWNNQMRKRLGFTDANPVSGERVICCKNNHKLKLLNGEQFIVVDCQQRDHDTVRLNLRRDDGDMVQVESDVFLFRGGNVKEMPPAQDHRSIFDFAYAITVHKSQGSQWDRVMVLDQSHVFRENAAKWLYTAITRAAEQVVVVR
jgi:exodeoxyribonuclease-5